MTLSFSLFLELLMDKAATKNKWYDLNWYNKEVGLNLSTLN